MTTARLSSPVLCKLGTKLRLFELFILAGYRLEQTKLQVKLLVC